MSGHEGGDLSGLTLLAGIIVALLLVFAAATRLPVVAAGWRRHVLRGGIVLAAVTVVVLANVALFRNDVHIDLTREKAFTPSDDARRVVRGLGERVEVYYFFQKQNPAARVMVTHLELLARESRNFAFTAVDVDQRPALATRMGVRVYNTAVIIAGDRRAELVTTDEREVALALLRLIRQPHVVCFATGHGEYDIDNFEFHTHFEGSHNHSHDAAGMAVVQMEQHGLGRLRRALEKIGLAVRKVPLAAARPIEPDCAALVLANPRTRFTPPESGMLQRYLAAGGSLLLLVEPDYPVDESLAGVLAASGIAIGDGVIVDPADHYYVDEQMLAVTRYGAHPVSRGLALSFYPGARPLQVLSVPGVRAVALLASSDRSYVLAERLQREIPAGPRSRQVFGIAAEGRLVGGTRDFRMVVIGDADFASNSFFPYLANADLNLAAIAWLLREEAAPAMKPPVEVLPMVTLTNEQVRGIFIVTVILMPGIIALLGAMVWWRRRR